MIRTEQLDIKTAKLLDKYDVPGAAIAILENGEVKWTEKIAQYGPNTACLVPITQSA